jgi:co-chaperonin GroES (HSP10)
MINLNTVQIKKIKPLHDYVIVNDMNFDSRITSGGIYIHKDDSKLSGIRPRWAQVYAIGDEQKDVQVGQWVCVAHGRWTRGVQIDDGNGVKMIRRVDCNDILLVSDERPSDDTVADGL